MAWLWLYGAMSILTAAVYAWDKRQAGRGGRRIRESTLHLLELFFGWPGALLAQQIFRHKRRKPAYMLTFAAIVAAHAGAWLWAFYGW